MPTANQDEHYIIVHRWIEKDELDLLFRLSKAYIGSQLLSKDRQNTQNRFQQAHDYLYHVGQAKAWLEAIVQHPVASIIDLEESLRNGIVLAEVVQKLSPEKPLRIFRDTRLQFRHTDNIAIFFRFLDLVEMPDAFRFDLIDLYERENTPKVIFCIHVLSWLLYKNGKVAFQISNLESRLFFDDIEVEATRKRLDQLGDKIPTFPTF